MTEPAGLDTFVHTLRSHGSFERGTTVWVARAPGRLDVMGGIADYSGSLMLQRPIAEATWAAARRIARPVLEIVSLGRPSVAVPLEALAPAGRAVEYADARRRFAEGADRWTAYVAGVVLVLARERGVPLTAGLRLVIASDVPEGKGVSSSAAVETATMCAAAAALDVPVDPREMALLCQMAENLVAGAPCGVMDQMSCIFGRAHALMALLCQPAELQPPVAIPEDIDVWGLDSGERHAVGGSDYGAVRAGAFMGLRILADHVAVPGQYLANLDADIFERELLPLLPGEMTGREFLARYGGTADSVTTVDPARRYVVRAAAAHPVSERRRAETFRRLLLDPADEARRRALGELMSGSHRGYGDCGLGSRGTDRLVELVRAEGPAAGLYGARITGGGSGGTVAVLGRADAAPAVARVAAAYARETGYRPYVFTGSSDGVSAFGARSVSL